MDSFQCRLTLREEIFAGINFREFFFEHSVGINFRELTFTKDFTGINFRECNFYKYFEGINFAFTLRKIFSTTLVYGFENDLSKNYYFYLNTWQNNWWSSEDLIQKTLYHTETLNIRGSSILEKFRGNYFAQITNFENFAGVDIRESTFSGVKKRIQFRKFGQNSTRFFSPNAFHGQSREISFEFQKYIWKLLYGGEDVSFQRG